MNSFKLIQNDPMFPLLVLMMVLGLNFFVVLKRSSVPTTRFSTDSIHSHQNDLLKRRHFNLNSKTHLTKRDIQGLFKRFPDISVEGIKVLRLIPHILSMGFLFFLDAAGLLLLLPPPSPRSTRILTQR